MGFPGGSYYGYLPVILVSTWPLMVVATALLVLRLVAWFKFAQPTVEALVWNLLSFVISLIAQSLITVWAVDLYNMRDSPAPEPTDKVTTWNESKHLGYTFGVVAIAIGKLAVASYFGALLGKVYHHQLIALYSLALSNVSPL